MVGLLCLLAASGGSTMDLQAMLSGAVENDTRVKVLSGELSNTLLAIERARLAPGIQMKLSTGEVRFGYSLFPDSGDPPWLVSMEPAGTLVLGRQTETQINVEVPIAFRFGGDTDLALLPRMSIRQPLDKLFGGEKFTKAQDRQNRLAAEKARIEVLKRVQDVEQGLLDQLSTILSLEAAGRRLEHELTTAAEALDQSKKLETSRAGSAQQRQLEFAVVKLRREIEYNRMQHDRAWQELERRVGRRVDAVPADLPEPKLAPPDSRLEERNPDVYLASLAVDVETARLAEERDPPKPKFFLGGAVDSRYDEVKDRTYTTVGGKLEGVFDDVTVSAGVGSVVETGTVFLSAGLSWSMKDRRIDSLDLKERENALEVSRWDLETARQAYLSAREVLALEIQDLELRRRALEEDISLADQKLADARKWLEQGFSTRREVDALRWEREKLDYSARSLRLDALQVRSRLDALVALDGDKS